MTCAGDLNRLVNIERPEKAKTATGANKAIKWVRHCKAWANIQPISNKSADNRNDKQVAVGAFEIIVRFRRDIKTNMRVVDREGVVYMIQQPPRDKDGRRESLQLITRLYDDSEVSYS